MFIYSNTTSHLPELDIARLFIDAARAKDLLALHKHWQPLDAVLAELYCIEVFDTAMDYGNIDDPGLSDQLNNSGGWKPGRKCVFTSRVRDTVVPTLRITRNGLIWATGVRNAEYPEEIETAKLTWETLQDIINQETWHRQKKGKKARRSRAH
jgi:hypothetical protein